MKALPKDSKVSWRIPVCDECEKRNPGMILLKDELWWEIAKEKREILCLNCIERRLGRPITFYDLKDCGLTREMEAGAEIYMREIGQPYHADFLKEY